MWMGKKLRKKIKIFQEINTYFVLDMQPHLESKESFNGLSAVPCPYSDY